MLSLIVRRQATTLFVTLQVVFTAKCFGTPRAPKWSVAGVTSFVVESVSRVVSAVAAEPALIALGAQCCWLSWIFPQIVIGCLQH